ncbi:MAG: DUF4844 domain-containing protein [Dechloromonas sp.]|nr:DUF4844 domain-containing protein [Dechloromonas sp.]
MFSVILKVIIALVAVSGLFVLAGVTGLMFYLWPTALGDHPLNITPKIISELKLIQHEKKFLEDLPNHYPGAPNEVIRINAQATVDSLIQILVVELPSHPRRSFVLGAMKTTFASFSNQDTEEQEQMLSYCERILAVLKIESSGELFNVWRYGFPYRWMSRAQPGG